MATLDLFATLYAWRCSSCHAMFDALWRPINGDKGWKPPKSWQWSTDKPPFKYCPMCGQEYKETNCGDEVCSI